MQWTDRIRRVKILLVAAAVVFVALSLVVSHRLVSDLEVEERNKMEIWAEAMRSLNQADETTDLNLVLKVLNENNTIPVVVTDDEGQVQIYRNLPLKGTNAEDSVKQASEAAQRMKADGRFIRLNLWETPQEAAQNDSAKTSYNYIDVCYDESLVLRRLNVYPFVSLGVAAIFVVVAIIALLTSKRAEQNKVWVGLSKETAHQLGTPISSLMAWTEVLRENYPNDELLPEMEKDVQRLQLIAERFSKIGSLPEPVPTSLMDVMNHVADYMDRRTSQQVKMVKIFPSQDIIVRLNASLFEWVIENLCKNAVDAMSGKGTITLFMQDEDSRVAIEISDTGKGIRKKDIGQVFRPGFTTKARGWGLGLSLARRIVEEYHHGHIFVKSSEVGKGTTFRIELKK